MGNQRFRPFRAVGVFASTGLMLGLSALLGAGLGYYLDKRWGTAPWLLVVGFFFGLAAGFVEMFEMLKKLE